MPDPRHDIIAFVRRQRLGVVSSIGPDGAPASAVVGIGTSDAGEVVFDSLGSARKVQNLRRDRRIALVVWEDARTVQLEGEADEPTGAELERMRAVYFAAYPDGVERLAWEGITHVRITPRWARYSDFAPAPTPYIVEVEWPPRSTS